MKVLMTTGLLAVLIGLGAADTVLYKQYPWLEQPSIHADLQPEDETNGIDWDRQSSSTANALAITDKDSIPEVDEAGDASTGSAVSSMQENTEGGVSINSGPNIPATLTNFGFQFIEPKESNIIGLVIEDATVQSRVLLKQKDRAGLITWVDSPKIKQYYLAIKEALHTSFSPQVADLLDENQKREGRPPYDLLTFLDPGISDERIIFVRVRSRLYEFHIAEGHEQEIYDLIEELTK